MIFQIPFFFFADFSFIDGSEIDKEEQSERGSFSGSSECVVGTTTQGLENLPPTKGEQPHLKDICFYCYEIP